MRHRFYSGGISFEGETVGDVAQDVIDFIHEPFLFELSESFAEDVCSDAFCKFNARLWRAIHHSRSHDLYIQGSRLPPRDETQHAVPLLGHALNLMSCL